MIEQQLLFRPAVSNNTPQKNTSEGVIPVLLRDEPLQGFEFYTADESTHTDSKKI